MNIIFDRVCGFGRAPGYDSGFAYGCQEKGRQRKQQIATFGTKTAELLALRDWARAVAGHECGGWSLPESTGNRCIGFLEEGFKVLLVNAAHIKKRTGAQNRRQGRLVDSRSCWNCGLLRGSFVPPPTDSGNPGSDAIPQRS